MSGVPTKAWYDAYYAAAPRTLTPWYASILECIERRRPQGPLVELGCGAGLLLDELCARGVYSPAQLFGVEQSTQAIAGLRERLPNVGAGDVEARLPYESDSMGAVVLAEVIEHLLQPWSALQEIHRVLRPGGTLFLSFPNYLNLPWLAIRVLAEMLDKPHWVVLQPIDHIFTAPLLARKLRERGFVIDELVGNTYWGPKFHEWEPRWWRAGMNALHLAGFSFHPVFVCVKA